MRTSAFSAGLLCLLTFSLNACGGNRVDRALTGGAFGGAGGAAAAAVFGPVGAGVGAIVGAGIGATIGLATDVSQVNLGRPIYK